MSTLIKLRIKCKLETLLKVKAALFLMIINIEPVQSKVWIHPDMLSKFFSYCTWRVRMFTESYERTHMELCNKLCSNCSNWVFLLDVSVVWMMARYYHTVSKFMRPISVLIFSLVWEFQDRVFWEISNDTLLHLLKMYLE